MAEETQQLTARRGGIYTEQTVLGAENNILGRGNTTSNIQRCERIRLVQKIEVKGFLPDHFVFMADTSTC